MLTNLVIVLLYLLFQEVSHLTVGNAVVLQTSRSKQIAVLRRIEDNKGEPTVEVSLLTLFCCGIIILIDAFLNGKLHLTLLYNKKALLYSLK